MIEPQYDVEEFMKAGEQPIRDTPSVLYAAEEAFRWDLIEEETEELKHALKKLGYARSKVMDTETVELLHAEVFDGIVDSVYVIVGLASALGYDFEAGWNEVCKSNMSKVDAGTGTLLKREDGKVLKPESFIPADFRKVLFGKENK